MQNLTSCRTSILFLLVICFSSLFPAAADEMHILDGNAYVIEVQKTGDALFQNENIEFEGGNFETTFMEDKGYGKGSYSAEKDGNQIRWKASIKNKKGDLLTWEGLENEGTVQGNITSKESKATWSFKSAPRN